MEPGRGVVEALRTDWREIGGLGRLALVGIVLAFLGTLALGWSITHTVEHHLLRVRAQVIANDVDDLPPLPVASGDLAQFDAQIREHLLGGETVRVKVWGRDGTVLYSDEPSLVGRRFELSEPARVAFSGAPGVQVSELQDPAHEIDREAGRLIELYLPFRADDGSPVVLEVEQDVTEFAGALGSIATQVWWSIGLGLGTLGVAMVALAVARARDVNRRRRQAERLLGALFRAQEEEQRRVVGALHDEVGQRLYRLLYGLEGVRAALEREPELVEEIDHLQEVGREIEATLRRELRILHRGLAADAGLVTALEDLAETTRRETGLHVDVHASLEREPGEVHRTALYRAAQEAVTNVRKHAAASRIDIRVTNTTGRVVLEVADDGRGSTGAFPGLGLATTRERLEALGGGLDVRDTLVGGVRFVAWVPQEGP